jgi:hypothetical protein
MYIGVEEKVVEGQKIEQPGIVLRLGEVIE